MPAPMSAAEKGRFETPPQGLLNRLKPFDYRRDTGIKPAHVRIFGDVAGRLNVTLLLRATNPASVRYMGQARYAAKPIDCKAKTADEDVALGDQPVDCAGLVADPNVVGRRAYKSRKWQKALDSWQQFEASMHKRQLGNGVVVYERAEHRGFYTVDIAPPGSLDRHHGCLLVSDHAPPADFDPRKSHSRQWMSRHMGYVHGDYDLYGVIDHAAIAEAATAADPLHLEAVRQARLLGQPHAVGPQSLRVVAALNDALQCDLVKHAEQSAYEFTDSDVYLFFPSGLVSVVLERDFKQPGREMPGWFEDLYRYVFRTGYAGRERVSERALR